MDIIELRKKINEIDDQMVKLFCDRMDLGKDIAEYKRLNNLNVLDRTREREIINRLTEGKSEEMASCLKILYTNIFELMRSYQNRLLNPSCELSENIKLALEKNLSAFPTSARIACQGTEGAYSQIACDKLFARPSIMYVNNFRAVFAAVQSGMCQYGILPIENSVHGSVSAVYDLMKEYKFSIVRSLKLHVHHALLANKGTKIADIKEIVSHEQAIGQCSEFLAKNPNIKITICENTAVAAKMVHDSGRNDIAALSSHDCASLYNLEILSDTVQNNDNNYTRFICITRDLEIYEGASKISLVFTLSHKPGSLYDLISKFASRGMNLTKLESRPIPGKDFEFLFYFDVEIHSKDQLPSIISELATYPEKFDFLGFYSEI